MIEIRNLRKKFGDNEVLKGINIDIKKGNVIAIIGPSGTGKSTLLRCINALERADEGTIKINEFNADFSNINKNDIHTLRTRTSMVFQNSNLYRNKTALENIMEPLITVKKIEKREAEKTAIKLLEKVGMYDKKDSYPETLSGGEKQRVGIARAMGVEADIMLFDEPTSALDPELVNEVLDVIKSLANQHTTMLIVTHEMKFAKEVADEIIFMEGGNIVERAPSHEFFSNPKKERSREFIKLESKKIDLNKEIDRRSSTSYKWNNFKNKMNDPEVYPMWVADMEFEVSDSIKNNLMNRIKHGIFGYDMLSEEYYKAVQRWLKDKHGYNIEYKDIIYCADTMAGLSAFIQAFTEIGDEVILNTPIYGNFFKTIKGCGRNIIESKLVYNNNKYYIDFEDMESRLSNKTKAMIICNPQNPTGTVWSTEEIEKVCMFCKKNNIYLISDEVHYDFIYNNKKHTMTASIAEKFDLPVVTLISPGKSFNISGAGGASIISKDDKITQKINEFYEKMKYPFANSFVEPATIGAYMESDRWFEDIYNYIQENRNYFEKFVRERIPNIKIKSGDSTYLMWIDCSNLNLNNEQLKKKWEDECKIIPSMGIEFGDDYSSYVRLNIACSRNKLKEILERMEKVLNK